MDTEISVDAYAALLRQVLAAVESRVPEQVQAAAKALSEYHKAVADLHAILSQA